MTRMVSRRTFLLGASAAAGLAACSRGLRYAPADDAGRPTGELRVLNWPQYIDEDEGATLGTVSRFTRETRTEVEYSDAYEGNEYGLTTLFEPKLAKGRSIGFDVVVPTYWVVARLLEQGLLNQIPLERVPNHVNVDPALLGMAWDRGARFHMPWQVGITGIAYNASLTGREVRSFADLLDPALRGRVGMVKEMREVVGLFMLAAGADPSRATVDTANEALDRLEAVVNAGQVAKFTANEYVDALTSGEFAACLAWSGDVVQLQKKRPDIKFVIPTEGGIRWFDSMVIPKGATNVASAGDWMNFVYDPANAAKITASVQYISPVVGVREELQRAGGEPAKLADNPILFPDDATRRRLYFWAGTTTAEEAALQARFDFITS
ncbi:MAG TPA: spermidine/putrescine ABC transporter substrate-binding protein [Frankiaceae bacterium]|jgi:spermidine/putrescine transport system substrate-binding protein|nr:spermidine/putrescine ABC transporter substrate-binding protein [Frankiaceae bacterium]